MTKIYLVVFKNENSEIYDFEVFTNRKKAEQYKRYWDAVAKINENFKGDTIMIVEQKINNIDYTNEANKKEAELLPF